jgi:hypothetical protein
VSKLLINEPALQVLPSLAVAIGLNEAIVVQQVHYWLGMKGIGKVVNGQKWVYNTIGEWQEQFPFWSTDTVRRTLVSLRKSGLLIGECLADNAFDKTMHYRIDYDVLATIEDGILPSSDGGKLPPSAAAKPSLPLDRTETTTETTQKKSAPRVSLPEWLDPELWEAWVAYRRKKDRGTASEFAMKLWLRDMTDVYTGGHDVRKAVEKSISRNWAAVFSPTNDPTKVSSKQPKSLNDMDYSADLF